MASIILTPGEEFEHLHAGVSITRLDSGAVELRLPSGAQTLRQGEEVEVPAQTPHRLVNVGTTEAVIYCGRCG